ncbi:MAG: helix-turn-helix domain-containing protein [Pseudomonadales bacterium]|nr:helix-turn-helix domain-containing protein [Pseudomonadales bacterium]
MQFGDKIRLLRQERNWTQPELAEKLNIEQSWLSKVENNKNLPSNEFVVDCLDVFDISMKELLSGLDSAYLNTQLTSISVIRQAIGDSQSKQFHRRKKWLVLSSAACVLGVSFCLAAWMNLIAPSTVQRYVSNGVIYSGEPLELFDNPQRALVQLNLFDIPEDLEQYYVRDNRVVIATGPLKVFLDEQKGAFEQKILSRHSVEEIITYQDAGEYLIRPSEVSEGAIDIYGNAASEGRRVFHLHSAMSPNPINSAVWISGFLLFLGGIFGFFVDHRLSRIDFSS